LVVMTERAAMFLIGPAVVRDVAGEDVDMYELGGRRVHERNGVCDFVVADDRSGVELARGLLGYLPQYAGGDLPRGSAVDPVAICSTTCAQNGANWHRKIARIVTDSPAWRRWGGDLDTP
jgi:acetyl-CoA carboxylase carboxyltransferase component